jgi:hypothetical protein
MLSRLNSGGIEYVVIGGVAANFHGSPQATFDLDVCCRKTEQNMVRMTEVLRPLNPVTRDFRKIPIRIRPQLLLEADTLIMATDLCAFDILSEVSGVGKFDEVSRNSILAEFYGLSVPMLNLDALIAAKRAAARNKDKEAVGYLERIRAAAAKTTAWPL